MEKIERKTKLKGRWVEREIMEKGRKSREKKTEKENSG